MCGLCGVLGVDDHWSDTLGTNDQSDESRIRRQRERTRRVSFANATLRRYNLQLYTWQKTSYVLSTLTGQTVVFDHFAALGSHVEALIGKICDPLDDAVIDLVGRRRDEF